MIFVYSLNTYSQFKTLYDYEVSNSKNELDFIKLKIKKKIFNLSEKDLKRDSQIIYEFKREKIFYQRIYDDKYLFIFYFPESLKGKSYGLEILRLNQLEIIDLIDPKNKWFFDFSNLEKEHNLGLGFQNISKFDPTEVKLYFTFNFTYDEKSQIEGR